MTDGAVGPSFVAVLRAKEGAVGVTAHLHQRVGVIVGAKMGEATAGRGDVPLGSVESDGS